MRVGNVIMRGRWDELLGTEIILSDERGESTSLCLLHSSLVGDRNGVLMAMALQ